MTGPLYDVFFTASYLLTEIFAYGLFYLQTIFTDELIFVTGYGAKKSLSAALSHVLSESCDRGKSDIQ